MSPTKLSSKFDSSTVAVYKQQYSAGYTVTKHKAKKKKSYDTVFPTGIDDGKGARRLLQTYVEEALSAHQKKPHISMDLSVITNDFKQCNFLEQVNHMEMNSIPLPSQVAKQQALNPKHSTEKKKRIIDIARRLKRDDSTLVRVRLNNESVDDEVLMQITLALPKNKCLQHLMLHHNAITDEGLMYLCMSLRWHPNFHCLWIGANKISDIGAKHVSSLLHRNHRIKEVNLSNKWPNKVWAKNEYDLHPHITYIGSEYISKQLVKGCGLTSLSLADQRIRDDGAIELFQSLIFCELRSLNIKGNEITSRCCTALDTALRQNPLLEILNLSHNTIQDDGALLIAAGIAHNFKLHAIDLSDNLIGDTGLDALYHCLDKNSILGTLVTLNNTGSDDRAEVRASARKHGIFGFGTQAVATTGDSSTLPIEQRQDRHRHHHLSGDHYHSGNMFLSEDELVAIQTASSAVVHGNTLVNDNDDNSTVEFGETVHVEGDSVTVSQQPPSRSTPGRRRQLQPEEQLELQAQVINQQPRLPSPWRTTITSSRPPTAVTQGEVGAHIVVPGVGVLGRSSLSTSYRNLFASDGPFDERNGIGRSRSNSHDGNTNGEIKSVGLPKVVSSPSPLSSPALTLTRKNLSQHAMLQSEDGGDTDNPGSIHGSSAGSATSSVRNDTPPSDGQQQRPKLKKKPSFVRTLSNLSAASINTASTDHEQVSNVDTMPNTAEKIVRRREKRAAKEYRNSFYGSLVTRENTPNFPSGAASLPQSVSLCTVPSRDLGKTVGIPHIKNIGVLPVRTSIASDRDSAQHFIYLRIATAGDKADERPTSLLKIANDREKEIEKLKKTRQTYQYKQDKHYALTHVTKLHTQKSAEPKVPEAFWQEWKKKIRLQYIKGIDKAKGCTSTRLEPIPLAIRTSMTMQSPAEVAAALSASTASAASEINTDAHSHNSHAITSNSSSHLGRRNSMIVVPMRRQSSVAALTPIVPSQSKYDQGVYNHLNIKDHPELAYQRHLGSKKSTATPGEILAARRKENLIRIAAKEKEAKEMEREKHVMFEKK